MRTFLASISIFVVLLINWTHGQNPAFSMLDALARARNALRLLELDSIYLNLPYGERDVRDVKFSLFTIKNRYNGQTLVPNDPTSIKSSNFDSKRKTKILIHGYTQNVDSLDFPQRIKNAYFRVKNPEKNYNVICVDWSALSKEIIYFDSANYTTSVGHAIGDFLIFLKANAFINNYSELHLIGFSLGAHVAGVVGDYIHKLNGETEKIGRITGLDPAGPGFSSVPRSQRLDKEDADFVDVIHSNQGSILTGDLGSIGLHGHADFYPNGGRRQPGCEYSVFSEYSLPRRSSCSHLKATEYYEKSILDEVKYVGIKCENWKTFQNRACGEEFNKADDAGNTNYAFQTAIMGENCKPGSRGKFYLNTR